jgi:hypothetical protein
MTRGNRKEVDRSLADRYRRVGSSLIGTARVMAELASDSDNFGNATPSWRCMPASPTTMRSPSPGAE